MRFAVISDIHGNLEALQAVLTDIDNSRIDAVFSLGDHIGYGPDPEAVVAEMTARKFPAVMGNHELAVIEPAHLEWFNSAARQSLTKSIAMLSNESVDSIGRMKKVMTHAGCLFVHGFPPDSVNTYRFQVIGEERLQVMQSMSQPICFIGHTHELALLSSDGKSTTRQILYEGTVDLPKNGRHIINVGSVGQPRDGNNNAKYAIWDSNEFSLEIKYIPYDIAAVAEKIIAADLPRSHANRLW